MNPFEDHVTAARQALSAVRTDMDFDIWHETFAHGETYINLPDEQAKAIDALADEGRQRVMSHLFPIMAG